MTNWNNVLVVVVVDAAILFFSACRRRCCGRVKTMCVLSAFWMLELDHIRESARLLLLCAFFEWLDRWPGRSETSLYGRRRGRESTSLESNFIIMCPHKTNERTKQYLFLNPNWEWTKSKSFLHLDARFFPFCGFIFFELRRHSKSSSFLMVPGIAVRNQILQIEFINQTSRLIVCVFISCTFVRLVTLTWSD